jgi:hypothetical protein
MEPKVKVSYDALALMVDKLYPPHYQLKSNETAEEHCAYIAEVINSCGWTEESYIDEYVRRGTQELYPNDRLN